MIRGAGVGFGVQDIWMTGYANGVCDITEEGCNGIGKVSYLGGHQYSVNVPISRNPQTQGARLFLNSLYEAGCVTAEGQPAISLHKSGPSATATANVTYLIAYTNAGFGAALNAVVTDAIPPGSAFVSATAGGTFSGGTVTWKLGDVARTSSGSMSVTVTLPAKGTYTNQANATFTVGLNTLTATSNKTTTVWGDCGSNSDCSSPNVCDMTTSTCVAPPDAGADAAADGGASGSDASADATTGDGGDDASADATTPDAEDGAMAGDDGGDATAVDDGGGSDATTSGSSSGASGSGSTSNGSSSGASSASGTSSGSSASGSGGGSASGSVGGSTGSSGVGSSATSGGAASSGTGSDDASSDNAGGVTSESSGCSCSQAGAPAEGTTGVAGALVALAVAASRRRRSRRL